MRESTLSLLILQLMNSDSVMQAHIVIMGQKRKRSCSRSAENDYDLMYNLDQNTLPTSSTNVAVNHLQPVGAGEGRRRMESPSRQFSDSSGQKVKVEDQGTAPAWQRSTEGESRVMWFLFTGALYIKKSRLHIQLNILN